MTPWTACQAPLSRGFPRQEYWSRLPFPSPGDLPDPGIESRYPALAGEFFSIEPSGSLRFSIGTSFSEIPDPSNIRISTCRFWFLKRHLTVKHETVLWQPHTKVAHNWPSWWHPPIGTDLVCLFFLAHWYLQKGLGFYSPYHPITIQGLHFTSLKGRTWLCVIMICLLPFWRLPFSKTVSTVIKGVCQILVFSTRLWFLDLFLTCLCEFKLNCTVRTWLPKNSL